MSGNKTKLNADDWAALFPEREFKIGATSLHLMPLNLSSLARIMTQLNSIGQQLDQSGIVITNLSTKDTPTMLLLVSIILEHCPSVLSELSGLDVSDIQMLPVGIALDLFVECVDLNINSHEGLLKNFNRLGDKVASLVKVTQLP